MNATKSGLENPKQQNAVHSGKSHAASYSGDGKKLLPLDPVV